MDDDDRRLVLESGTQTGREQRGDGGYNKNTGNSIQQAMMRIKARLTADTDENKRRTATYCSTTTLCSTTTYCSTTTLCSTTTYWSTNRAMRPNSRSQFNVPVQFVFKS